jgi:4-amino-4-deoxy-L-arabinose transferase-like glycosyltransferase
MLFVDSTLSPSQQATATAILSTTTFVAGIIALVALVVAALVALVWFVSLCVTVIVELGTHIALLYTQSDPVVKLLMLVLIAYAAVKLLRLVRR